MTTTKVVIDPLTRIEGHLRVELLAENKSIKDAYACTTQFRGIENVLSGRDPRDAWVFTQRICGVCTFTHGLCSIAAIEDALQYPAPACRTGLAIPRAVSKRSRIRLKNW